MPSTVVLKLKLIGVPPDITVLLVAVDQEYESPGLPPVALTIVASKPPLADEPE